MDIYDDIEDLRVFRGKDEPVLDWAARIVVEHKKDKDEEISMLRTMLKYYEKLYKETTQITP